MEASFHALAEQLRSRNSFCLTTHINPDADAIGSTCALASTLRALGKEVRVINSSPTPENLSFLPGTEYIEMFDASVHSAAISSADLIVCLDFNVPKRCGEHGELIATLRSNVVMIDHHTDPAEFYAYAIHDVDATSTAELVYKFLATCFPQELDKDIATNLYAGIMADSGNFRFPRVCPATHYIVAELLELGADPVSIYDTMYNSWSIDRTRLVADAVAHMTLHCNNRLCLMTVPQSMYVRHNCTEDAVESAVHQTLSIKGVNCGVLLAERQSTGEIKVSFRSKGNFTVNSLAAQFGGGGHIYAAGARIRGMSLSEATEAVLGAVQAAYDAQDRGL